MNEEYISDNQETLAHKPIMGKENSKIKRSLPKRPPSKMRGCIFGLIVVFLLAVTIIVSIISSLIKTTKEQVQDAFDATKSSLKVSTIFDDVLGLSKFSEDDVDMSFSLSVEECEEVSYLENLTVNMDCSLEEGKSTTNVDVDLSLEAEDQEINFGVSRVDGVVYLEAPELFSEVIEMNITGLMDTVEIVGDELGVTGLYDTYLATPKKKLDKSISYEKLGKITYANANGEEVTCKEYLMTIPNDTFRVYVEAYCDYLVEYADTYIGSDFLENAGYDLDEIQEFFDDFKEDFKTTCTDDYQVYFYIKKGKVRRISFEYDVVIDGETVTVNFLADFMGEKNVGDDVEVTLSTTTDTAQVTLVATSVTRSEKDGTTKVDEITLTGTDGELYYRGTQYVSGDNEFEITGEFLIDEDSIFAYDAYGEFTDIVKGKSFGANVNGLTISLGGEDIFALSGTFAYGNMNKKVSAPDDGATIVDYTEFSDLDIDSSAMTDFLSALVGEDLSDQEEDEEEVSDEDDDTLSYSSIYDWLLEDEEEYEDEVVEDDAEDDYQTGGTRSFSDCGHNITINVPDEFQSFADYDTEAYIFDSDYSITYTVFIAYDLELYCQSYIDMYDNLSDTYTVLNSEITTVNGMTCLLIDMYLSNSSYYLSQCIYFYPLSGDDYVEVEVSEYSFTGETGLTSKYEELANTFATSDVINEE